MRNPMSWRTSLDRLAAMDPRDADFVVLELTDGARWRSTARRGPCAAISSAP